MIFVNIVSAQDLVITREGDVYNAYNLEIGDTSVYFNLSDDPKSEIKRMFKSDILSIRKADGTKMSFGNQAANTKGNSKTENFPERRLRPRPTHEPVEAVLSSPIKTDKNGRKFFSAKTPDGHELNYEILPDAGTAKVRIGNYRELYYVIPERINVNGNIYVVTEIGNDAFSNKNITSVQFPSTLKKIGFSAFWYTKLEEIILPDGLEEIGGAAFYSVSYKKFIKEIYIPTSVTKMGHNSFWNVGKIVSPRGKTQAYFSCLPMIVNQSNSNYYGIDDSAVEAYEKALENLKK